MQTLVKTPVKTFMLLLAMTAPVVAQQAEPPFSPATIAFANELIDKATTDRTGYQLIESLTTEVGPRLAGTEAEARARYWAVDRLVDMGFKNVHIEEFNVRYWNRLSESAQILTPYPQDLTITALGGSTSTGPEGVEGQVVSFPSLAALQAQPDKALKGKIVFIDEVMTRTQDGSGYGWAAKKRRETAYEAHRLGASAALIRSVGTSGHRFAHTGQMHRATSDIQPSVPCAALSSPDADQLARSLAHNKPVTLRLVIETETRPNAPSGNVIAEIPGRTHPDEIVVIGAHLDSWDLGTGAVDDGAGVGISVGAAKLLLDSLPKGLKRTVRVVLFGSEEVGLVGAKAYADEHKDELPNHIIGTESDFGAGRVWRFDTLVAEDQRHVTDAIAEVLAPLGVGPGLKKASGGPDMKYVREAGVPVVTLVQNGWDYFDLHHTPDDTFDKINPEDIAQNIAVLAAFTYLVADSDHYFREDQ